MYNNHHHSNNHQIIIIHQSYPIIIYLSYSRVSDLTNTTADRWLISSIHRHAVGWMILHAMEMIPIFRHLPLWEKHV